MRNPISKIVFACVMAAATAPAPAQGLLDELEVSESDVSAPGCQKESFATEVLGNFKKAQCQFHTQISQEKNAQTIELLQAAQNSGLPPVYQSFASLLEGLLHCRQATLQFARYQASSRHDLFAKLSFCRERRESLANLADVDWGRAFFRYGLSPRVGFTLKARIDEMAACHSGVLSADFHTECGLITMVSEDEMNAIVNDGTRAVLAKYFGGDVGDEGGGDNPVTAMFSRKLARSNQATANVGLRINGVKADAAVLNAQYDTLKAAYVAQVAPASVIVNGYQNAVLGANSILDEFDRWQGGLLLTPSGTDLKPAISTRGGELRDEGTRLSQHAATAVAGLTKMRQAWKALLAKPAVEANATLAMCRMYFCEMLPTRSIADAKQVCRAQSLQSNPLCVTDAGALRDGVLRLPSGQTRTVGDLCTDAGIAARLAAPGIGRTDADLCLADLVQQLKQERLQ